MGSDTSRVGRASDPAPASQVRDEDLGASVLILDDVRISTNVPQQAGERALGTRVSREVRESACRKNCL